MFAIRATDVDGLLLNLRHNVTLIICLIYLVVTLLITEMQSLIKWFGIRLKNIFFIPNL